MPDPVAFRRSGFYRSYHLHPYIFLHGSSSEMLSVTYQFTAVVRADAARFMSVISMMEGRCYVGWVCARREVARSVAVGGGGRGGHGDGGRVAHGGHAAGVGGHGGHHCLVCPGEPQQR